MENMRHDFERWVQKTKGRKARRGEFLESYVTFMYQSLLIEHAENVQVTKGAQVQDNRGRIYEIDVFFKFEIADVQHRVAIECKDHKRPVTRDDAIAFNGKITDMPSTIGVFISLSGFQRGAEEYLDDHGIEHYDGTSIPKFGSLVAARFQPLALPDSKAIGQPFWTLMEARNGTPTGRWLQVPVDAATRNGRLKRDNAVPLFWSKKEAERFQTLWDERGDTPTCVRGLTQPTLRAYTKLADMSEVRFVTMTPVAGQRPLYGAEIWEPGDLASEFISVPEKPETSS